MVKIKNRNRKFLLVISISFILLSSSCVLFPDEETSDTVPLTLTQKTEYKYITIMKQTYSKRVQGEGKIIPSKTCPMFFDFGGEYVKDIFVKLNSYVNKDDVLLELDNSNLVQEIKRYEIRYKIAQLKYEKRKAESCSEVELERLKLDIEGERIQLDYYLNKNKNMKLISPMDGYISFSRNIKKGDLVLADDIIFTVANANDLQIEYNGEGAAYLKKGMKVNVEYETKNLEGEVVENKEIKGYNNTNSVRIKLLNLKAAISINKPILINVQIFKKDNTVVIPRNALYYNDSSAYVVILENGTRVERGVKTGFEYDYDVEITEGLVEGDKVIIE